MMTETQRALWTTIQGFHIGPEGARFPFSAKLARENEWNAAFTTRAIEEYKKFLFLGQVAGHPVSPSEAVDEVWHLHLTYTEDYWKRLCQGVLEGPFHHNPSAGGSEEAAKYEDMYAKTLASYERVFGSPPPADIWPSPEERRQPKPKTAQVDLSQHWVLRKPKLRWSHLGLVAVAAAVTGCTQANPLDWKGPEFLTFFLISYPVTLGLALWWRDTLRTPNSGPTNPTLDPYEIAYLNGGPTLAVNTAIAHLVKDGWAELSSNDRKITTRGVGFDALPPVARAVAYAATGSAGTKITDIRSAVAPVMEGLSQRLKVEGLLVDDYQTAKMRTLPLLLAFAVPALGLAKIGVGLDRGKPIVFLVLLCILATVFNLGCFLQKVLRSKYGDEVLAELQNRNAHLRRLSTSPDDLVTDDLLDGVALFGLACLDNTPYAQVNTVLGPPAGSTSCGSGCGSSCGGGGGDSGGGGCGGCGGGGD